MKPTDQSPIELSSSGPKRDIVVGRVGFNNRQPFSNVDREITMQKSKLGLRKYRLKRFLPPFGVLVALFIGGLVGCNGSAPPGSAAGAASDTSATAAFSVSLTIRTADQPPLLELVADCTPQMTLLGWMTQLNREKRLEFTHRGDGELAFVESIAGQGDARGSQGFWTYRINDQVIKQSCGAVVLKPNDRVEWIFGGKVNFDE